MAGITVTWNVIDRFPICAFPTNDIPCPPIGRHVSAADAHTQCSTPSSPWQPDRYGSRRPRHGKRVNLDRSRWVPHPSLDGSWLRVARQWVGIKLQLHVREGQRLAGAHDLLDDAGVQTPSDHLPADFDARLTGRAERWRPWRAYGALHLRTAGVDADDLMERDDDQQAA